MQINAVVFLHAHRLADGRIITHAHPIWSENQNPVQPNHHSAGELLLLDAISHAIFTADFPPLPGLVPAFAHWVIRIASYVPEVPCFVSSLVLSLRGPPATRVSLS